MRKPSQPVRSRKNLERSPAREEETEAKPKAKRDAVMSAFEKIWSELFSSPVHLDSALSKQSKSVKSILAQIIPVVLLRPSTQAESLGVGIPPGEPWSLSSEKLSKWRPAVLMAERIYENMAQRPVSTEATGEDFPPSMTQAWENSWGADVSTALARVLGQEPPLSLRAARKVGPKALLDGLKDGSRLPVRAQVSELAPFGVRLASYAPVLGTAWYERAAFEIQDEGSQLMALFALWPEIYGKVLSGAPGPLDAESWKLALPPENPPPPAWTVIDACAGAGGKSLAIADALGGRGRVFSYDTSAKKLQALRRRAAHAGYTNIQAIALEEGKEAETIRRFRRTAQVVLVDAPCSGWGVLRRNPDIKWRQSPEVLERMPQIQGRLLSTYSELVAPGGRLVFGVCTFRPEETTAVVDGFLKVHPDFKARQGGYLGPGPCDGFFMQVLTR